MTPFPPRELNRNNQPHISNAGGGQWRTLLIHRHLPSTVCSLYLCQARSSLASNPPFPQSSNLARKKARKPSHACTIDFLLLLLPPPPPCRRSYQTCSAAFALAVKPYLLPHMSTRKTMNGAEVRLTMRVLSVCVGASPHGRPATGIYLHNPNREGRLRLCSFSLLLSA